MTFGIGKNRINFPIGQACRGLRAHIYINFKDEPWSVKKLAAVIAEVETDPLNISEDGTNNKSFIFTKKMKFTICRIVFAIVITLLCMFGLAKADLNWLRFSLYALTVLVIGYDIFYKVIVHLYRRANILDHNLLISIAALGSLTLAIIDLVNNENSISNNIAFDESMEAVMVITLFQIGSIIENVATNKSKAAIMSAVELRVDTANLVYEGGIKTVKPQDLKLNDCC